MTHGRTPDLLSIPVDLEFVADSDLLEEVCTENERDAALSAGGAKLSAITLPLGALSTYSGTYDVVAGGRFPVGTAAVVTVVVDRVMLQRPGDKIGLPLAPVSDTRFVLIGGGASVEFIKDANGAVTQLIFQNVEGQARAVRRSK